MRDKNVGANNRIYFWERIAFRISMGFLLPIIVSAYALYSVSGVYSEVSESKERMQRVWNGNHLIDGKALLTLNKIRMHALAYQYDRSPDLARQLEGEIKEYIIDVGNSRKGLESIAAEKGMQLDIQIVKSYSQLVEHHKALALGMQRLFVASQAQNALEIANSRKEVDRAARESESMFFRLHAQSDKFEGVLMSKLQEEEQRTSTTLSFYLIAVFLFGLVAAAAVTVSITFPVKTVLARIKDIARGDGDLTRRVTTRSGGEMKELALWLNEFLEKTHGIISTIANASATVHETTSQVGAHTEKMSVAAAGINKNMMEQSMNLDECTTRVGSIDDLIQNSGESTRQAASLSKIAMDRALQGGASVHETIEAMEKIQETARKVEELVSSINEIASQTNLLAINAAIEATKAGEHGKGFAVVAEEVRKLAERARKLTGEVTGLVGESSVRVRAGVGLAQAAGVSLDGIIKDVEAVASLIQRIAAASAKQTESSNVALEFMQKVSEAVRHNLQEMEGVTKATGLTAMEVTKLHALVAQLNEVVGQFRLSPDSARSDGINQSEHVAPPLPAAPVSAEPELPSIPGEMSFEAMMNPVPRAVPPAPLPRAGKPPLPGLTPLPPGAEPTAEGDEDAA